jgi:NADH:ubiquinone oxidoreductase subunit 5 (subunit L)/multisubunit Na+/H+ antiporter MnhA subunit
MAFILLAALIGLPVVAMLCYVLCPSWSARLVAIASWIAVASFVIALPTRAGSLEIRVMSIEFGLRFTPLALLWSVTVLAVGAVVISFASRYLQGVQELPMVTIAVSGVLTAIVSVVAASNVATLMLGWLLAGLCYLIAFAWSGRRTSAVVLVKAFILGDALITVAFLLVLMKLGNVTIAHLDQQHRLGHWAMPIALLFAAGVLVRSAQGPFLRWLRLTVDAPTPVSALLHAGVINGGMILILRLTPVVLGSVASVWLLAAVGGFTAVISLASARYRGDYKGKLVLSTSAQMGFVLVELAVGAFALALVHLILHAGYKAWLFLTSSSQVVSARPSSTLGSVSPWSRGGRLLIVSSSTALLAAVATLSVTAGRMSLVGVVLGCFVFASGLTYTLKALGGEHGWRRFATTCLGVVAAFSTLGIVVRLITNYTAASLSPRDVLSVSPLWLLVVGVAVIALTFAARDQRVRVALSAIGERPARVRQYRQESAPSARPISVESDDLELAG